MFIFLFWRNSISTEILRDNHKIGTIPVSTDGEVVVLWGVLVHAETECLFQKYQRCDCCRINGSYGIRVRQRTFLID